MTFVIYEGPHGAVEAPGPIVFPRNKRVKVSPELARDLLNNPHFKSGDKPATKEDE